MAFAALSHRAQKRDRAFPQRRSKERPAPGHGQPLLRCASRFDRELLQPAALTPCDVGAARVDSSDPVGWKRPETHFERLWTPGDAHRRDLAACGAYHQLIGAVRGVIATPRRPAAVARDARRARDRFKQMSLQRAWLV